MDNEDWQAMVLRWRADGSLPAKREPIGLYDINYFGRDYWDIFEDATKKYHENKINKCEVRKKIRPREMA